MSRTRKESGVSSGSTKSGVLPCYPPPSHVGEHRMPQDAQYPPRLSPSPCLSSAPTSSPGPAVRPWGCPKEPDKSQNPQEEANE